MRSANTSGRQTTSIFAQTNNLIWIPHRVNPKYQNSPHLDRWLSKIRELNVGVFQELQDTGRNIERLLAKTVVGLTARVITRMTAHLLRHLVRIDFGVNVQIFEADLDLNLGLKAFLKAAGGFLVMPQ